MPFRTVIMAALLVAGGCVSADQDARVTAAREESGVRALRTRMSMAEARVFFVDATRVVSAADKGSQVSYMAPDGAVHLWFPGNARVVRGRWSLEAAGYYVQVLARPVEAVRICFTYGADSRNAWTGESGRKTCVPADALRELTLERADGDVVGLSRADAVPFVLAAARTTLAALTARLR